MQTAMTSTTGTLSDFASAARNEGIASIVRRTAARYPDKTAIVFGDRSLTYTELVQASEAAASSLQAVGVCSGDRVAVLGRNSDIYVIAWLACQLLGAVHVPINFMLGSREVGYVLEHSGAAVALADIDLLQTLKDGAERAGLTLALGTMGGVAAEFPGCFEFPYGSDRTGFAEPIHTPGMMAQIAYTSGTESTPKGAMLTHASLTAQYVSCIVAGDYESHDVIVHALPLYHCAQMHCFLMPGLYLGTTNIILPAPEAGAVIGAIVRHSATSFFAPPTVWIGLLQDQRFDATALASLQKGYYGASIMPVRTVELLIERLPALRLWNYYGQTELGPLASCLGPADQLSKPGSAGLPVLNVTTRIVDDEMCDVGVGHVGEVVHRSPQVMSGYFNDDERTRAAFDGGWFHSGDLAVRDEDGYITIVDRKKDMINSGGENVSSREVEEILYRHNGVAEVAVVGVPDEKWIEAVYAFVVLKAGARIDGEELRAFARTDLAPFKVPKRVVFVDGLPKSASGKILKRELRLQAAASA
jgi:fatty-acyl-CoA synthase